MAGLAIGFWCHSATAALKVWDGGGSDNNWNTANNWNDNAVPGSSDDVVFDSGSKSVTVTATTTVNSISFEAGYSGTVTINSSVTLNAGNVSINDGLVGYWRLDESSDGTAVDASGFGNDLTHQNTPSFTPSVPTTLFRNPYAISFAKASAEYAGKTSYPAILQNSAWTLAAWVNHNASTDSSGSEIISINNDMGLRVLTTGNVRVHRYSGSFKHCETTATDLTGTGWKHVAATFDSSSGSFKIYIDGSQITGSLTDSDGQSDCTPFTGQSFTTALATPVKLGGHPTSGSYDFDGSMDDVRVYNHVLSASDIAHLAAGKPRPLQSQVLTVAGTGVLDIAGDLTISSRSVSFSAATTVNVGGSFYNFGGTTSGSATITLDGSGTEEVGGLGGALHGFTAGGTATRTLIDRMLVTGTLGVSGGTFDISNRVLRLGTLNQTGGSITSTGSTVIVGSSSNQTVTATSSLNELHVEDPTETNLIAYFKLDELAGSTTQDFSASANHGTLQNGPTWTSSVLPGGLDYPNAGALLFDKVDDAVSFSVPSTTNITIAAWVYMTGNGESDFPRIVGLPSAGFLIRGADSDKLNFDATFSNNAAWKTAGGISRNTWVHVAVTWDGTSTAPTFYINGTGQTGTVHTAPSGSYNPDSGTGYIGNRSDYNRTFEGYIDDVRIYDRILTAAEVTRLAAGEYAGTGGGATFTLGANTTASTQLTIHSGTLATSSSTLTASSGSNATVVKAGAGLTIGSAAASFGANLTVDNGATLTMNATGGEIRMASAKTLQVNGSLVTTTGTSTPKPTIKSQSGTYSFHVGTSATATPTVNIDGLAVQNTDTDGMFINQTSGATTTFTKFDNVAFSAGTGNYLLQIAHDTLTLHANGLSFDTTGTNATYNVKLTDRNGAGNDVRLYIGGTCTAPEDDCEAYDSDDDTAGVLGGSFDGVPDDADNDGAVIQWMHRSYSDIGGAIESFAAVAFDWDTFAYHATYVLTNNYSDGKDRLSKRTTDGAQYHADAVWDLPQDDDFVGAPRWIESGNTYYIYVLSAAGRVYKLQDAGNTFTELLDFRDGASATGTSPLILDTSNLYWAGASGTGTVSMFKLPQSTLTGVTSVATGAVYAAPSLYTISGTKYLFSAASTAVYKINTSFDPPDPLTLTNTTVRGRVSVILGSIYFIDDAGKFWAVDASSMSQTWSYQDTATHGSCSSGGDCEARNIYWDVALGRAYWGDKDGHIYAVSRDGETANGTLLWSTPFATGSNVFQSSPIYRSGVIGIGSTTGRVFFIDQRNGSNEAALIRAFYFGNTAINSIAYDFDGGEYVVATGDGKLYYISAALVADPTPGTI